MTGLTVGQLRKALKGIPDDTLVVTIDGEYGWNDWNQVHLTRGWLDTYGYLREGAGRPRSGESLVDVISVSPYGMDSFRREDTRCLTDPPF